MLVNHLYPRPPRDYGWIRVGINLLDGRVYAEGGIVEGRHIYLLKPFRLVCSILIITITIIRKAAVPAAMATITPVFSFDFELRDALTVVSVRVVVVIFEVSVYHNSPTAPRTRSILWQF